MCCLNDNDSQFTLTIVRNTYYPTDIRIDGQLRTMISA